MLAVVAAVLFFVAFILDLVDKYPEVLGCLLYGGLTLFALAFAFHVGFGGRFGPRR